MQSTALKLQTVYILDYPRRLKIFKRKAAIQGMQMGHSVSNHQMFKNVPGSLTFSDLFQILN